MYGPPVATGTVEVVVLVLDAGLAELLELEEAVELELEEIAELLELDALVVPELDEILLVELLVDEVLEGTMLVELEVLDVEVAAELEVLVGADPAIAYMLSLPPPPQYSIELPAQVIEHPLIPGTELDWFTDPALMTLPQ